MIDRRKPKPVAILTDIELIDEYIGFKGTPEQFRFKKGHHYYQYENPKARFITLCDEIKRRKITNEQIELRRKELEEEWYEYGEPFP